MYNFVEHSSNYSDMTGTLQFYSKDETADFNVDITNTDAFKSFKYKAKLLDNTVADGANEILKKQQLLYQ